MVRFTPLCNGSYRACRRYPVDRVRQRIRAGRLRRTDGKPCDYEGCGEDHNPTIRRRLPEAARRHLPLEIPESQQINHDYMSGLRSMALEMLLRAKFRKQARDFPADAGRLLRREHSHRVSNFILILRRITTRGTRTEMAEPADRSRHRATLRVDIWPVSASSMALPFLCIASRRDHARQ